MKKRKSNHKPKQNCDKKFHDLVAKAEERKARFRRARKRFNIQD